MMYPVLGDGHNESINSDIYIDIHKQHCKDSQYGMDDNHIIYHIIYHVSAMFHAVNFGMLIDLDLLAMGAEMHGSV